MSSWTGMDSTTSKMRPLSSQSCFSAARLSSGHTWPGFTSYTAVTMLRMPGIWRMYSSGMGSLLPYQRKESFMLLSPFLFNITG